VIILIVAWVAVAIAAARSSIRYGPGNVDDQPPGTIDPNVAAWHELTVLPRIGESKARAIIEHRHRMSQAGGAVFTRPADLTAVSGIGPRTAQRIAPELHFPHADRVTTSSPRPGPDPSASGGSGSGPNAHPPRTSNP
jgi:hypothetical protein